ncbi:phage holin family protein [Lysinibacter sp. HNR]|uniref:phage holin family protein n=1 Tax=Lysinibacter sp. HNR TaxID=3031408 RepID=UPI00243608DC|nr:phage holin family protein [Lysinibacter sp. HNR]WGD37650.1 phage holin family protein [Lysinibacter sp. HNR]
MRANERGSTASLFTLITRLFAQVISLARAELDNAKKEIIRKLKKLGLGIALLIVSLFFVFFAIACFVAAAIAGIATALPVWLSALIVAVALLLITAGCVWWGIRSLQKGVPIPDETLDSIEEDFKSMSEATGNGR